MKQLELWSAHSDVYYFTQNWTHGKLATEL